MGKNKTKKKNINIDLKKSKVLAMKNCDHKFYMKYQKPNGPRYDTIYECELCGYKVVT